ncbi:SDR family oxidoreductase [Paenibacillus sp. IB182496]|uniref:SDR family oxidoreductase n=1 Tax=Paenibacillus sabuli TaxID=2772509 RepID=A0A927BTT3_9BACL|nr:SDR family oxidoreductase [Paenibacillus sabuli]MBD2845394.1 SDR family oxidoreductase [Paenibacillus sabuli]
MKILVTGATGHLGSLVLDKLLETVPATELAVSVRDVSKAAHLQAKGVDVRQGNFDQPETLREALRGISRMLLISTAGEHRQAQHQAAVDAAREAGVQFVAYTSIVNAQASKAALADDHRATEAYIRESGMSYVFLRNNWYVENEQGGIQAVLQGMPWVHATGAAQVGWAAREDYAHAAAAVLTQDGHANKIYELAGPLRTTAELAALVGEVLGVEARVLEVDDEAYAQGLRAAGLPEFLVAVFTDMQKAIREGALATASDDLERLLGRPPQPLDHAIRAMAQP